MNSHLYDKFQHELDKLCSWLLKFANRMPAWRKTKPYELHNLLKYKVDLSSKPLLTIEVSFSETSEVNSASDGDEETEMRNKLASSTGSLASSDFVRQKRVPIKTRLRVLKPKQTKHAIFTNPLLEKVYFSLFKMVNYLCGQFHRVSRIENILYKRMKWKKAQPYLKVSPASVMRDDQLHNRVRIDKEKEEVAKK